MGEQQVLWETGEYDVDPRESNILILKIPIRSTELVGGKWNVDPLESSQRTYSGCAIRPEKTYKDC